MIYLDNAATTKPSKSAVEAMLSAVESFGNPSSLYGLGLESEKLINNSKKVIADMLGVDSKHIYFTSGGTEANNTAIFGEAYGRRKLGNHVITTAVEHPSVLEAFKRLEDDGFCVTYLGVDKDGLISLEELDRALTEETILVSVMHVNNETGVIMPVDKIKALMRKKSPDALLHCDCVQSFGKINVKPALWGADLVSISAHKIHGFKGTGAIYVNDTKIRPMIFGGEQQNKLRPGTENVGGILAFGAAAKECACDNSCVKNIRSRFIEEFTKRIDNIKINGSDENNSGSVLNISFKGIKAEILLHALERHEIYVSTGSACSSHKPQPSHVLTAMGLDKEWINGAVRLSFCEDISEEDIETVVTAFEKEVAAIRRFM
ncbi:MAG: cysteine desulfurase family protein [Clostridia bacterium]|nr:cysteine desulfurase family protein [Clostridia bacterium]